MTGFSLTYRCDDIHRRKYAYIFNATSLAQTITTGVNEIIMKDMDKTDMYYIVAKQNT